ncbi:MAG TPA: hypothetical protein VF747_13145 [Blastocatellia bacterium]|jgi:hypothetical protein
MMYKRFLASAALVLALMSVAGSGVGAFQGAPAIKKPDAAALNATDEILKSVSRLRALEVKHMVKAGFKTKDEIEASVIRDLDENTPPEEFNATQKTLLRLGLVPKEFRLRDFVVKLLREQVAGYYEPKTKEFYLAAWLPLSEQKKVIAHELVHALQDQHFNLRRFERWPKGDSDAELAVHALVEGEATLIMIQYDFEQQGMRLDMTKITPLTDRLLEADSNDYDPNYPVLSSAPTVLRENLQFPYIYGAGFAQAVLKSRSWAGLDKAYDVLPASTEQIMHPERFLARDNPVKIEMPDLASAFGRDWKLSDADVNGEFGFQVILSEFIAKPAARLAATGWGGDRYSLYENKATGATALIEFTTWDSASDAREFFDAYSERTEKRYKQKRAVVAEGRPRVYETAEGLVSIELRDKDVVIIEGAQDGEQLARISTRAWESKKAMR